MDKFFKISQRNSTVKREVIGGITTFFSMAYILFVNPSVLAEAGMNADAVFMTTAIASALACLMMGLYANYPVMLAPGMGMNAFFTYSVVIGMGYTYQEALFGIFVSGIIFMILSFSGIRERIINTIPPTLKYAVSAGIGLFIAFIGLTSIGVIVDNPDTLVGLGDLSNPVTLLGLLGVLMAFVLIGRGNNYALFITMVVTAIAGVVLHTLGVDMGIFIPTTLVSAPPSIDSVFLVAITETDPLKLLLDPVFWTVVFSLLFVDFFDTAGTLVATATEADLLDEENNLIDADRALVVDATATTLGSLIGTSSVTSYVESITGVKVGARTGLAAVVAGICFLLAIFFSPLLGVIGTYVTAPALISVGALMAVNKGRVDYSDFTNTASAFTTMIMMVLTYSIAEGISAGFIVYVVCKVGSGRYKEVDLIMYLITGLLFLHYFM